MMQDRRRTVSDRTGWAAAWLAAGGLLCCGAAGARRHSTYSTPAIRTNAAKKAASPITLSPAVLELGPGEMDIEEIRLANPYGHATVAGLRLNPGGGITLTPGQWDGDPLPPWGAKFYTKVRADASAGDGDHSVHLRYYVDRAGEYAADLPVKVRTPIEVTLIPDYNASAVRVRVHNLLATRTERGRVRLKNPQRLLQDVVSAILPPIPPGETREVSIPIIADGIAPGESYRFDATVETWAGYKTSLSQELKFYVALK